MRLGLQRIKRKGSPRAAMGRAAMSRSAMGRAAMEPGVIYCPIKLELVPKTELSGF